ncbi:MAG: 6-bladed beta-propeller [Cyclobacteriaceae bacterium]
MKTNRRSFIQKAGITTALATTGFSFNIINRSAMQGPVVGHGDFKYRVNKDWGVQDSSKIPVRDCHEMVQDSKGRLILLTNHVKNNIIIYDRSGKVTDTWTINAKGAHGLTISQEGGEEFLFITDEKLNKVWKTTLDGKVLLELNYPSMISDYQQASQWKPTETAVAPNGDIYVADGYGLNYIVRYSANGEYISHFGGKGDGDAQFDCCHGVTLDTRASTPALLITSRTKNEFKRFTLEGEHLETIATKGCWICRPVIKGEQLYFAVIVTKDWYNYDGMVAVLNKDNQVVSLPGGTAPAYEGGNLTPPDSDDVTFMNPHDVCIDQDENIYVAQWYSGRTYPIKLERV